MICHPQEEGTAMPLDTYVVRFAGDEEGREVHHEKIIDTASVPWPPHEYAAMGVVTTAEDENKMLAIVIHPDADATHEEYADQLGMLKDPMTLTALALYPGNKGIGLVWFRRVKTSQWDDDMVDNAFLMRGALYRPCTKDE